LSNHERNEWLIEPIPADRLADNVLVNAAEVERAIALARRFRTSSSPSTSATRRWWIGLTTWCRSTRASPTCDGSKGQIDSR